MRDATDTLYRQWLTLRLIPKAPRKAHAREILSGLRAQGQEVTLRTVERDLQALAGRFPLEADEREKPFGWSWKRGGRAFDLPTMTPADALALIMVERYLKPLLPAVVLDGLEGTLQAAHQVLDRQPRATRTVAWPDKVAVVQPTQPLLAPKIHLRAYEDLQEALLQDRQIVARYRRKGAAKAEECRLHPLGLVLRGPMTYLVCTFFDYEDIRLVAVHRLEGIQVLDDAAVRPKGFSLQTYIDEGHLGFGHGGAIRLEAIFDADAAEHLHETPLSGDQQIDELGDGNVRLTATVADTPQLRWWLLGFGGQVEVVSPPGLRSDIRCSAKEILCTYETEGAQES